MKMHNATLRRRAGAGECRARPRAVRKPLRGTSYQPCAFLRKPSPMPQARWTSVVVMTTPKTDAVKDDSS